MGFIVPKAPLRGEAWQSDKLKFAFLHKKRGWGHTKAESKEKEEMTMNCNANKSIECTVQSCAYHCDNANYCSLERILVGTHETDPAMDQCTDCKSFRKK